MVRRIPLQLRADADGWPGRLFLLAICGLMLYLLQRPDPAVLAAATLLLATAPAVPIPARRPARSTPRPEATP